MHILGIDIGGTGIKGFPVDTEDGTPLADRYRIETPQPATPKAIAKSVKQLVEHFDWKGPIGCAFPARIKKGIVQTASNIDKSFLGVNLEELLSKKTGLPVRAVNDADAAGIAEAKYGAGHGRNGVVLLLTVGTGIGSALIVNQTLVPNTEFGHIDIEGRNGERYASDRTRKRKDLSWKEWAKRFNSYLERIEFLLSPDVIILGGGVSKEERKQEYFSHLKSDAKLITAELANNAGIIGAADNARSLSTANPLG